MTDPVVAGPPAERDAVERQLERLEARLVSELGGGELVEQMVRDLFADAQQAYVGARVRTYLPILIERDVRRRLNSANDRPDQPDRTAPGS